MKIAIVGSALAKEFKQFHQIYFYCSSSIKYMFKQIVLVTSIIIFGDVEQTTIIQRFLY